MPFPIIAQGFTVEVRPGLLTGISQEYVFEGEKQMSRLEWDQKAAPCVHTLLNFEWRQFFVEGGIMFAIPAKSGLMHDYDYLLPNSNALTNFSEHDAFLDRHNAFAIGLGYKFSPGNWFIIPSGGFQYVNRKWTANNGWLRYASAGNALQGDEPVRYFSGPVISYEQMVSFFYADVVVSYSLLKELHIGVNCRVYPYIWFESMDHHIMRNTQFLDIIPGGFGGSIGVTVGYKPSRSGNFEFFAGSMFEKQFFVKGTTAKRKTGLNEDLTFKQSNEYFAAYDSTLWNFFIGVKLTGIQE